MTINDRQTRVTACGECWRAASYAVSLRNLSNVPLCQRCAARLWIRLIGRIASAEAQRSAAASKPCQRMPNPISPAVSDTKALATQFVKQRLSLLQIGSVEAFGEPVVNFRQHSARFVALPLLREQSREARRRAQFGILCRCVDAFSIAARKHVSASAALAESLISNSSPCNR
jgi:hypothetical protein